MQASSGTEQLQFAAVEHQVLQWGYSCAGQLLWSGPAALVSEPAVVQTGTRPGSAAKRGLDERQGVRLAGSLR